MEYTRDFDLSLAAGEVGEDILRGVLADSRIEVKTDHQASRTGNIYVELESRGKPSGIATTKADWVAYLIPDIGNQTPDEYVPRIENLLGIVLLPTDVLRLAQHLGRPKSGGDDNTSRGFLLPLSRLPLTLQHLHEARTAEERGREYAEEWN